MELLASTLFVPALFSLASLVWILLFISVLAYAGRRRK